MPPKHRARRQRPGENRKWIKPAATALMMIAKSLWDWYINNKGC